MPKIGLEVHVQLKTKSKLFCRCKNPVDVEAKPNSLVCETCLGFPGAKPVLNKAALNAGIKLALALNCKINRRFSFSRKTYFYPDLPKNFQITQYEFPLAENGWIDIGKKIRIKRIHIEEDPGKLFHIGGVGGKYVLVDYNRSGIPLLEIVTEPDMENPEEARRFIQKLENILEYLEIYESGKCIIKSDANISISGERVEVKNITGSKEVEQALKFEIVRQEKLLATGKSIRRETRMWIPEFKATRSLREKEEEEEYGYIFEPDLTVIELSDKYIQQVKLGLPELPDERLRRFMKEYEINRELAESLISEKEIADFFEAVAKHSDPKLAAGWIASVLKKTLNWHGIKLSDTGIKPEWFVNLLNMLKANKITDFATEIVIRKMVEKPSPPDILISKLGLERIGIEKVEHVIKEVLKKNKKAVHDYLKGEEKALHFLIGECVKATSGRVSAKEIREFILKLVSKDA